MKIYHSDRFANFYTNIKQDLNDTKPNTQHSYACSVKVDSSNKSWDGDAHDKKKKEKGKEKHCCTWTLKS